MILLKGSLLVYSSADKALGQHYSLTLTFLVLSLYILFKGKLYPCNIVFDVRNRLFEETYSCRLNT